MTLSHLLKREIKAFLKNPAFILAVVLILGIYGTLGNITGKATESAVREMLEARIGLVMEEDTQLVRQVVELLNITLNGKVYLYDSLDRAISETGIGVVLPRGFTENATSTDKPVLIKGSVRVMAFSITSGQARIGVLSTVSNTLERILPIAIGAIYNVSIQPQKPVVLNSTILLYEREIDYSVFSSIMFMISLAPMLVSIVFGINATYASQLVAIEKAEKAFEMLLAQPIKRRDIVLAKILGASIASIIFGAIYLIGIFAIYTGGQGSPVQEVSGMTTTPFTLMLNIFGPWILIITGSALVLGLVFSGAIGVIIGSAVSDERIAGGLAAPIMFIFIGVGFSIMFMGLQPSISTAILAGLTIAPLPYIYAISTLSGDVFLMVYSIGIAIGMCALLIYLATSMFNRDIVVLGLRISWARKQKERV
ncbi:MAG: ABC transporter permease [Desulfurococcaceae archaeon]